MNEDTANERAEISASSSGTLNISESSAPLEFLYVYMDIIISSIVSVVLSGGITWYVTRCYFNRQMERSRQEMECYHKRQMKEFKENMEHYHNLQKEELREEIHQLKQFLINRFESASPWAYLALVERLGLSPPSIPQEESDARDTSSHESTTRRT